MSAQAAAGTATPAGLPYGTSAAARAGTAPTAAELAQTGPAVPSAVAVLLVTAGLLVALVARGDARPEE